MSFGTQMKPSVSGIKDWLDVRLGARPKIGLGIGLHVLLVYLLVVALAALFIRHIFVEEVKPGVRQAVEAALVDSAHLLAELAVDDMRDGTIANGCFAAHFRDYARRRIEAPISGLKKDSLDYRVYITDAKGIVVFDSSGRAIGQDYSRWNDVYLTLQGRYGARSSRDIADDDNSSVMYVAAPIMDRDRDNGKGRLLGVLTVAKPNRAMQPVIWRSQKTILLWGGVLLALLLTIGAVLSWSITRHLEALRRYAQDVTAGGRARPPERGPAEIVELGGALEAMRRELDGKEYVENYIHTLTHEMKSPLAAIRGAAELIEEPLPEADRRHFARNIGEQAQRLSSLIDRLLALAAVEHLQVLEKNETVDVPTLVAETLAALRVRIAQAERCGIRVEVEGLEDTEETSGGHRAPAVRGDPFLLRQALANLLDNALDFSPLSSPEGALVLLRVEREEQEEEEEAPGVDAEKTADRPAVYARFSIVDQGPGIPDYALPRVFERFYSLPRPGGDEKRGRRGTGLGLCFVRQVATLHRGTVSIANVTDSADADGAPRGVMAVLRIPAA